MGLIARQSIKGSIYTYAGALLGFVNAGLLMPKFFKTEEVGLVNLLIAVTLIFSQLGSFGLGAKALLSTAIARSPCNTAIVTAG